MSSLLGEDFGAIEQLGFVVQDLDQALQAWSESQGVGPWVVIRNITFTGSFDEQATEVVLNMALAYRGELQIELIQQMNDAPSPYLKCAKSGYSGLHHVGYFFDEDFENADAKALAQGLVSRYQVTSGLDARYIYYSMPGMPESYVEFIESDAGSRALFDELKSATVATNNSLIFQEFSF